MEMAARLFLVHVSGNGMGGHGVFARNWASNARAMHPFDHFRRGRIYGGSSLFQAGQQSGPRHLAFVCLVGKYLSLAGRIFLCRTDNIGVS